MTCLSIGLLMICQDILSPVKMYIGGLLQVTVPLAKYLHIPVTFQDHTSKDPTNVVRFVCVCVCVCLSRLRNMK